MPGDSIDLNVLFQKAVPLTVGLKIILREGNLTIGAGVITELLFN